MVTTPSIVEMSIELESLHRAGKLPAQWRRGTRELNWIQIVKWHFPRWSWPIMLKVRSRWEKYLALHPQTRVLWFSWRCRTLSESAKHCADYDKIRKRSAIIHPRIVEEHPNDWVILTDAVVESYLDAYPPHGGHQPPRMPPLLNAWDNLVLSVEHSLVEGETISRTPMDSGVCVCVCPEEPPEVAHAWWALRMDRRTSTEQRAHKYINAPHWVPDEDKDAWEERMNP